MEERQIQYMLKGIDLLAKEIKERTSLVDTQVYHFDLNFETRVQADKKLVIPIIAIQVRGDADPLEIIAKVKVAYLFEIVDFETHILLNESNVYEIPPILEHAIMPLSISTTRGIMYSEFRGTYVNNAILPVVTIQPRKKEDANDGVIPTQ